MNIGTKILNKIQHYNTKFTPHDQAGFILVLQGCFNISKSINMMHHFKRMKDKIHMIIWIDEEKAEQIRYRRNIPPNNKDHLK
jgi:hypothetical protein